MVKTNFMHHVRNLHTNNGGEYKSKEFKEYLENEGITHEFTAPYTL